MRNCKRKTGLTLIEILVVITIIAILAAIVIGIAARIDIQGKKQLTESTFALLDTALEQFRDYEYSYDPNSIYAGLDFPLDCNDFLPNQLEAALEAALGLGSVDIDGDHDPNYSGSEAMYFFLSKVPESRQTLDRIDNSLITDQPDIEISVDGDPNQPLFRVIDPWGETLRYDYYDEDNLNPFDDIKTFPVITSAGPDGEFGSTDDIISR